MMSQTLEQQCMFHSGCFNYLGRQDLLKFLEQKLYNLIL